MPDLNQRLRGIDRLSPPDLLSEARVKAEEASSRRSGMAVTPLRRLATIVVALVVGLGGVAALFLAFGRDEQRTEPAAPVPEKIVFSSLIFPNAPGQIYAMAPDGSDLVQLTRGAESYSSVSISPDGERMAYVRFDLDAGSGGGPHPEGIYVANADGTDATEVFRSGETPQSIIEIEWSPDGRSLGFVLRSIPSGESSEADWRYELWVMGADGSHPHPVSDDRITSFSWSPAGDRFAVTKETVAGNRSVDDIFVIGLDGSNLARLTSQGASRDPIWSPDGERILFAEGWVPDGPRVMMMGADGSEVEPLPLQYGGWTEPLAWAPDSEQVLVRGGNDKHECSVLLASATGGGTSVLLEGTTVSATQPLGPGETPSATGDPCVQSASWSGASQASQAPTPSAGPLAHGSIVFTREEPEGGCDLFTIEPDGTGLRPLTATPSMCETGPAVAPGGSTVAVSLELDDIAVIDLATSGLRRLTDDPATLDGSPAWSPDGSRIVFFRGPEMGPSHIYVMNTDGTHVRQLTQGSGSDHNPVWSPDGTRIAFARSGNYAYEVYVMDADGSNVKAVTSVAAESAPSPVWSPDGSQIALDVDGAIYVVSADGTGLRRLSPELPRGVLDMRPSWSPDGTQIAFTRYTNEDVAASPEDGDIWIIDADGADATRVTHGSAIDNWPQWVSGTAG